MLIKKRIYISLLLFSLLPLILISYLTEQVAKKSLQQIITNDFQVLTREKAHAIGRHIDERINETHMLAKHPAIISAVHKANAQYQSQDMSTVMDKVHKQDKEWINSKGESILAKAIANNQISQLLKEIQARKPESYGEIFLTDQLGMTLGMTKTLSDYYQGDEYWWQYTRYTLNGKAFLDDRGFDKSVGEIVIGVVVPIIDHNEIIGILKINFRVRAILQIVSGEKLEPGYELILSRSDGSIITTSNSAIKKLSENKEKRSKWLSASHLIKHKFTTRVIKGAVVGISGETTQIEKTWNVTYKVEKSIAFSSLKKLQETAILLAIIAFILATIIGFLLSRTITEPLSVLNQGIKIIGSGNLTHRIALKAKNEFATLASSFNNMTQELQDTLASRDELNQEVAERKQAQHELESLKYYLNEILDAMPSIVIGVDKKAIITHWNRQAIISTNISIEQAIGSELEKLLTIFPSHIEKIINAITTNKNLKLSRINYTILNQNYYADLLIYPLTAPGIEGAVIRVDDITDQILMQQAAFQTEKMLSVGSLATGMAHELNNPLGGILQGIQNIRRRLSDELKNNITIAQEHKLDLKQAQAYFHQRMIYTIIDSIEEAGKRAAQIITNMMSFSQTEKSAIKLYDLAKLIDEVISLARIDYDMKTKFGFSDINIIRDYQNNLPHINSLDKELKQVILNILRNSAQALSNQINSPSPDIEPSINIRLSSYADKVNIEIKDSGPGMDSETLTRIFEPFYTTQAVGQGTGLGLSIAYYIIHEQLLGEIKAESTIGQGTKITIQLPLDMDK